ncbi:MAG: hypothetical protein PHE17_10945 [Thiothrix sp.]|uniref:hypothetical protein n=1 Tax=Thiothrix sp. TaxID=1032 RepID=UPI0026289FD2|nr:hypothetical protein [Thiothrix sp.]MDD5393523.1 hypothetical protein [Thiothrix sp.]
MRISRLSVLLSDTWWSAAFQQVAWRGKMPWFTNHNKETAMRLLLRILLIVLLGIALFGCATQALHSNKSSSTEKIKSFLVTQDAATLVVAGEEHHFIFPLGEPLKSLLQWQGRNKLTPTFGTFSVNAGQTVTGNYTLQSNLAQLSATEKRFLTQRGFKAGNNTSVLEYSATIQGTRYLAGDVKVPQTAYFHQPYRVSIIAPDDAADTAAKIALTPLALAADGVTAVLGGIVLAPFFGLWVLSGGY